MRKLSKYVKGDRQILENLETLVDKSKSPLEYSSAFYILGQKLSVPINEKIKEKEAVVVACSSEDADWLAKGIIDNLKSQTNRLVVFWNLRTQPFGNKDLLIAPIIKTYAENIDYCDTLIVCKSIIYTSCVVRTNLTYLIEKINPKTILIAAPVIFKLAEKSLRSEFNPSISDKFEFIYFAKDDKATSKGEVIPGIGGEIYQRLGLNDVLQKNKYVPELVKERRG